MAKSDFRRRVQSIFMSEYQVKLEAIGEYQDALRYKKMNEELCGSLFGLLGQLTRYFEKNGIELPEDVSKVMQRTSEVLDSRLQ